MDSWLSMTCQECHKVRSTLTVNVIIFKGCKFSGFCHWIFLYQDIFHRKDTSKPRKQNWKNPFQVVIGEIYVKPLKITVSTSDALIRFFSNFYSIMDNTITNLMLEFYLISKCFIHTILLYIFLTSARQILFWFHKRNLSDNQNSYLMIWQYLIC